MRAEEFITEAKTVDYEGLTLKITKNNYELMVDALDDWGNNVLGHVTFYIGDDKELDPQDLWVNEKYQGQGIAKVMYDYVKKIGYKIVRSYDQTDAGKGFWDKHRGEEVRVWESSNQSVAERKKGRKKKSRRHGGYFFPGYGFYGGGGDSGEGGGDGGGESINRGMAEGFPQPGESSGKAKQFNPNAKVQTKEMTLDQILGTVKGIPYVNNVVDDWDAKDYSWGVTKKVIEYAQYLQKNPQSVANLPPLVVIDGQLNDGAHRLSAINLLQKRMDPKNPLWKQVKLKVNFGTSADVAPEQG